MRRVVVTGMGIVSSIGNTTQEVLANLREAKSGISRADKYAELGFRSQVHGAPSLDASEVVDRRAMRFHGGDTAWNHVAMEQAIAGFRPRRERHLQRTHRHHHGIGRTVCARNRGSRRRHPQQGAQTRRAFRGPESDVLNRIGDPRHLVQDPRHELLDLIGLRDLQSLHRQRCRNDPVRASRT